MEKENKESIFKQIGKYAGTALLGFTLAYGYGTYQNNKKNTVYDNLQETPLEQTLSNSKIEEFKRLFLDDETLGTLFTYQELSNIINKNLENIRLAELNEDHNGFYNPSEKKIVISKKNYTNNELETYLFHELMHTIFKHSDNTNGFEKLSNTKYLGFIKSSRLTGVGINEAIIEYANQKLLSKTDHKRELRIFGLFFESCAVFMYSVWRENNI